jgi:superfamily II DNA or RNA helicase
LGGVAVVIQLRPYQTDLIARTYQSYQAGNRNVLAVLPTGGGKSVIVSQIILDGHQQGLSECVIAHRNELVGQMSLHVARRGIPHRIIASKQSVAQITAEHRREFGRSFINPDARCSVVSVDTLVAREAELQAWAAQIQRWTIDEAHHVLRANKWGKAVRMFTNAYGLGVTATPRRADGMGLGEHHDGVFQDMILGPSMRDLIDMGALCEYEIAVPESDFQIDDDQLAPSGDWSSKRMREASKRSHIVGDVVIEYQRRAPGKRGICFATDVETANEMAHRFNEAGIAAAAVSAKTPNEVRNDYIRRFRDGRLTMLVNVDLFGEGFDVPAVEVVIMARPTASLAVYLQQFGRALRPLDGKPYGLVIDHVSNWKRHGFPDKQHLWSLDRREKRAKRELDPDDIPLTACRSCSRPYERCLPACPYCGEAPPVPEGGARSIEQVDGDLMLLDRETLAQLRAQMTLEAPGDVAARVEFAAGPVAAAGAKNRAIERHAAQQRLTRAIEQWAGIRRAAGDTDATIMRRFYLTVGADVLSVMGGSRAEMDGLAEKVEGWYR